MTYKIDKEYLIESMEEAWWEATRIEILIRDQLERFYCPTSPDSAKSNIPAHIECQLKDLFAAMETGLRNIRDFVKNLLDESNESGDQQ